MAFFENSITFEESVERFAHYMANELEAMKKKEDECYDKIIEEEIRKIDEFWSKEMDNEEKELDLITESLPENSEKPQQRFESPRKMTRPSESNSVSKKYQKQISEIACPEGTRCQFHKFHTGNKIIIFNCQHSTNFKLRRELQRAIIDGTLKNMDLDPQKAIKKQEKI